MLCGCRDYLFSFSRSRNNSRVKELHRLCGQRGAYDSKRANKCPLILFLGFLETIFNGEGEITSRATSADTVLYGNYF